MRSFDKTLTLLITFAVIIVSGCKHSGPEKGKTLESHKAVSYSGSDCQDLAQICPREIENGFGLIVDGIQADVQIGLEADPGIQLAGASLVEDLAAVSGDTGTDPNRAIIAGEIGKSELIDDLIKEGKIDVSPIEGNWEGFIHAVVDNPMDGVTRALVIAGSDKRGTIFGIYDLSEKMGVSPWHWWADVPVQKKEVLYVSSGQRDDRPDVKYRGIFLNDENPALYGWAHEKFGGFGDEFYAEVFELILRQKGNYIWPAMWGKAYYDDDPDNAALARNYGIVVGTSHHEPLGRAHVEWERYGEGAWDYSKNEAVLKDFWRGGMERMKNNEVLVTIGMRGDGDEAMTEGTAITLLEDIVKTQREIIADVTQKPAYETPQVWALYKEVQDYYDQGMSVPEDVILLFSDDNWGNIRRLPDLGSEREGGYGIYYHFDYVGGPRNHKWLNTTQIERVWEQMHMASEYGADELWIVNVGDLKPMEFPISFFLDMGWDTDFITLETVPDYYTEWASAQFGSEHAQQIGGLIKGYTKLNSRRKPELIEPGTFSLVHFDEADRVGDEWRALETGADILRAELDSDCHDAFDQLVWWPIKASANLNHLYIAAEKNRLYAEQKRASANDWADRTEDLFARDAELTEYYHSEIADGKWNHFASQTHIGYTYWQQPEQNNIPELSRLQIPDQGVLGVSVEGDEMAHFGKKKTVQLPQLDRAYGKDRVITLFNTGQKPIRWEAKSLSNYVDLSQSEGSLEKEAEISLSVNWNSVPEGESQSIIEIRGEEGTTQNVVLPLDNVKYPVSFSGFIPRNNIIAIEANEFTSAVNGGIRWKVLDNLSPTASGVAAYPVTAPASEPGEGGPHLAYEAYLPEAGDYHLSVRTAPSLDYWGEGGLNFAASIDDGPISPLNIFAQPDSPAWNEAVASNGFTRKTTLRVTSAGAHTVKLWRVDPGVVFQRLVITKADGLPTSYLGPLPSKAIEAGTTK